MALSLNKPKLDNLASDIWKSAERLRGKFKFYECRSVILPIIVIVSVVFWLTDANDQPAIVTEPYEKAFTAANLKKEQEFHESDLTFRVRVKANGKERTVEFTLKPKDNAAKKFREALTDAGETLSVEWTHRHYVQDDEYIPHGEDIGAFLKREIAKPIIRWADGPQLGCEILPNKYFYRYQPPTPAKELLAEFWRLEKEAEKLLEGLAQ